MAGSSKVWIALIRGIGAKTYKKMSMQDLREACEAAGLKRVSTYIASGNLLFVSSMTKTQLKSVLAEVLDSFGLDNAIILRRPRELEAVVAQRPHAKAAELRPNLLHVVFFDQKVKVTVLESLDARGLPEKLELLDRELCVDYLEGVARSKLTPALIDRTAVQPGTARNWNTTTKLIDLAKKIETT